MLPKGRALCVTCVQPCATEHAIPYPNSEGLLKRTQRWQRIVIEAARQGRRCFWPEGRPLQNLATVLEQPSNDLKLVLWEAGSVALAEALPAQAPTGGSLLIGPEGGFASGEVKQAQAVGFLPVSLGPRILRTETAAIVAAALAQSYLGDLG